MCKLGLPPGWFPAVLPGFIPNLLAAVGATVQMGLDILSSLFFSKVAGLFCVAEGCVLPVF